MKNILLVISSAVLLTGAACKTKKQTETPAKSNQPVESAVCEVKVNFGSAGTGIDAKKYDEIKLLIEGKKLKYTEKNVGREGEREICLPLNELKGTEKTSFVEQLKKSASSGQYVSVSGS